MQKRLIAVVAAAMLAAVPALGLAATVAPNSVNTAAIQNLAVTTAKIANGAVTATQIATGTITANQLANGAVTSTKLATGAVANGNLADNSVSSSKIVDGAVTDAKISGTISAAKLAGLISVDKLATYAGIKIVHAGPVDNTSTFNSVSAALNAIADNSETNRYTIVVMPGNYVEAGTLSLKSYVDIIGQNKASTTIKSDGIYTDSAVIANITLDATWLALNGANTIKNCKIINTDTIIYGENVKIEDSQIGSLTIETYFPINPETITLNNIIANSLYSRLNGTPKSLVVTNSTIDNGALTFGNATYMNCTFNAGVSFEEYGGEVTVKLHSCLVKGDLNVGSIPIGGSNAVDVEIDNSIVESVGGDRIFHFNGAVNGPTGTVKIGNSKLTGSLYTRYNAPGQAKLVNCHDGNYNPIPNGIY